MSANTSNSRPESNKGRRRTPPDAVRGRVRAHDPFELIRWLAMSQPDPRKALAELVQNSLDAEARNVRVTRVRERGVPCLKIHDDGAGVIPELDRAEALRYIATHIGHSRKRSLSPEQRMTLMTQGQYGIGLLGFWSLGQRLEIRTGVAGQRPQRLILHRDDPDFLIEPLGGRLPLEDRWTEVIVAGLHREATSALVGRRASDYLAAELRGQLLARDVTLTIEDRMTRGLGQKLIVVRPPQFLGERLQGIGPVEVPGHTPIRFEIYFAGEEEQGEERRGLAVYASGTLVAEGFHELAALDLDRSPWNDIRLSGIVDFPDFRVAPGSRRGVLIDDAAGAFASALAAVEPILTGLLETYERRKIEKLDRTLVRDLQRAFRDFYKQRPSYAMLPVRDEKDEAAAPGADGAGAAGSGGGNASDAASLAGGETLEEAETTGGKESSITPAELLPPGPLANVRITPAVVLVERSATKSVRATAFDITGRPIESDVTFSWRLDPSVGSLIERGGEPGQEHAASRRKHSSRVELLASDTPIEGVLAVLARSDGIEAVAEARVEVVDELSSLRSAEGIPEPEFVDQPGAPWRSRMQENRWQVNSGHRDFRAIADRAPLKLRYLALLFAKEVVLRSHQDPRLDQPLEQLAEIVAYADRNLSAKRRGRSSPAGAQLES